MSTIELYRDDLFPWCKKISLKMLQLNEHVDIERLRKEGSIKNYDLVKTDLIVFIDDDGTRKVLREK